MKQRTALLILDMQTLMVNRFPTANGIIPNVAKAISNARNNDIPVIYVALGFRQGAPEINENNKVFSSNKAMFANTKTEDFITIHPDLAPRENEITVIKRRVSAFSGSDLDIILRAHNIRHIVLAGIVTSGVVLSTLCEAADKDYSITVLSDCCADRDEEVHRLMISKVFLRHADVMTVSEWIKK